MNPGYFVVCEGLDAAGKTTSILQAVSSLQDAGFDVVYSKGLQTRTIAGSISRQCPSTYTLLGEIVYLDRTVVRPALNAGYLVLQDRWQYSVLSHHPLDPFERFFSRLAVPVLSRPDLLVHFTVSLEERLARLSEREDARDGLLSNPDLIKEREGRLLQAYAAFPGEKVIIDTTGKTVEESAKTLCQFICSFTERQYPSGC